MKKESKSWSSYSKFAADFETTAPENFTDEEILIENRSVDDEINLKPKKDSKVFLACLMSIKTNKYRISYENLDDFFTNIANMTISEHKRQCVVWFHVLAYDGSYILNWLLKKGWKQSLRKSRYGKDILGYKTFSLLSSNSKFYYISFIWKGIVIKFWDSSKYFPISLEQLGEKIGYRKLSKLVNYSKFKIKLNHNYSKNVLKYIIRDCEILSEFLKEWFKQEPRAATITRSTIGSIAYSYIKKIIRDRTPEYTVADFNMINPYNHGGYCSPSLKYWAKWVIGNIKVIDRNSMYGAILSGFIPYGKSLDKKPTNTTYCCFYEINIKFADIKKEHEDFPIIWKPFIIEDKKVFLDNVDGDFAYSKEYQYIPRVKNKKYFLVDKEFEMWKKIYNIDYEIVKTIYFKTAPYLASVINKFYEAKQEAMKNHDKVALLISKSKLVNLTGKLSQKPSRQQDYYGTKDSIDQSKYKICSKKETEFEAYNIEKIRQPEEKASPNFITAYVTALSRVALYEKYLEIKQKGGDYLYSDTDALVYNDPKNNIEPDNMGIGLGQWKYEAIGDAFCCLCPKQYRIFSKNTKTITKQATAGVKPKIMLEVKNQDYNFDLCNNNNYKIVKNELVQGKSGKIITENPYNFKKWKRLKKNPICPKELWQ